MATKEKNNNKGHHSFYKEANKSILGQQQWTPKKIGKTSFKIIKWLMFGFLIVATLWGCVNEFIIKTSHNLGQGVEFYRSDEFVYPNMYSSAEIVGYTIANESVTLGVDGKDDYFDAETKTANNETLPFNFYSINPNYGINVDEYSFVDKDKAATELQVDKYIIKSSDVKTITKQRKHADSVTDLPEVYSYNLNQASVILTNIFSYSMDQLSSEAGGMMAPSSSLVPESVKKFLTQKIDDASLGEDAYKVDGWINFVYYMYDSKDGLDGAINESSIPAKGNWIEGEGDHKEDFFNISEDADLSDGIQRDEFFGLNGTLTLKNPTTFKPSSIDEIADIDNWKPIYSIPMKIKDPEAEDPDTAEMIDNIEGQVVREINNNAFLNGTGKSSYNDFIKGNDALEKAIEDQGGVGSVVEEYSVDYTGLNLIPKDSKVYGGAEEVVVPIKKGFPIAPSDKTINLIEGEDSKGGYRDSNFESQKLTDNKDMGFDSTIQNYGWMIMDNDGNLKRVYDNKEDALKKKDLTSEDEKDALYGDQRRLGWGKLAYGEEDKITDNTSVFDEKIKTFMNSEKYLSLDQKTKIGEEEVTYNYGTRFAGMTSAAQIQNFKSDATGVLPRYEKQTHTGQDDSYWETSLLSDSINVTGQDSWNETRVAFQGWGDWDKAWDVNKFGLLYGAFVFPISQLSMGIGTLFHYQDSPWGTVFSIFIIVFLVRGLGALLSMKGTKNQLKMQEVQTDVAKIKAKYSKYDLKEDKKMKQKQQLEIMALYKKNEVNPMGSLGTIFITMPIFISLWIIISALPAYKVAIMGNFSFSVSAWYGMFNLGLMFFLYLLVGITVGLVQGVSSKLPNWLSNKRKGVKRIDEATKKSMKKQNRTQNIMVGVFIFMGLTVPAMFAVYWIASGLFTILLELGRHAFRVKKANKIKEQ